MMQPSHPLGMQVCLLLLKDQACKGFFGEFLPQQ